MVCFSLTPKLLVICYSTETQTWDSLMKAGIPLPGYVTGHAIPLQKRTCLSLQPFAEVSNTGFHVCIFCSGSQQAQLLFFHFSLSLFFSPYIHMYSFYSSSPEILVWVESFWLLFFFVVFSFHLISYYYSLCPNATALHVMRWVSCC